MDGRDKLLVNELTKLLLGGGAHVTLRGALKGLPPELRGVKPHRMPYSIWQLLEHIRIAQWDMFQFCKDENHKSPKWPDEYWSEKNAPDDDSEWNASLVQIENDLEGFIELMEHSDIYQILPHGEGQTILREALQIADHNSYHIGEIIAIRRALNAWD